MQIVIPSKNLRTALNQVSAAPTTGSVNGMIEISAGMEGVKFTKQTNVCLLSITSDCEVEEEGAIMVDAGQLSGFASRIEGDIRIAVDTTGKVVVKCEGVRLVVAAITKPEDYAIREMEEIKPWEMPAARLLDILETTIPCMAREKGREKCMGLIIENIGGKMHLIGTDGRQFCFHRTKLKDKLNLMVPLAACEAMRKILSSAAHDEQIEFGIGDTSVMLKTATAEFHCSLFGESPASVAPVLTKLGDPVTKITVAKARLAEAVVAGTTYDGNSFINLDYGGSELSISVDKAELNYNAAFDCEIEGEEGRKCINGDYLAQMLANQEGDKVEILVFNEPAEIIGIKTDDYFAGVLTVRTNRT